MTRTQGNVLIVLAVLILGLLSAGWVRLRISDTRQWDYLIVTLDDTELEDKLEKWSGVEVAYPPYRNEDGTWRVILRHPRR